MSPSGVSRDQSYIKHLLASWMAPRCQVDPSDAIHRDSQGVNIYSFSAVEKKVTPKNRELPFYRYPHIVVDIMVPILYIIGILGYISYSFSCVPISSQAPCLSLPRKPAVPYHSQAATPFSAMPRRSFRRRQMRISQCECEDAWLKRSQKFSGIHSLLWLQWFGRCRCKKDTGLPDANLEGAVCRAQGPSSGVRHLRMSRIPIHRDKHRQSWLESLEILQRARMSLTFLFHIFMFISCIKGGTPCCHAHSLI